MVIAKIFRYIPITFHRILRWFLNQCTVHTTQLEKFLRISLYVTDDAIATLNVT